LTQDVSIVSIPIVLKARQISANQPAHPPDATVEVEHRRRGRASENATALRGKVSLSIDLDVSRERGRRQKK